ERAAAAQRAVADERAAIARAVVAERTAAAGGANRPPAGPHRWTVAGRPAAAPTGLGVAALLILARLWLVGSGSLFGTGPVRALDAVVAASVLLALAQVVHLPSPPTDRAGYARRIAVVLATPVLVAGGLTLLVPATPTSAPAPGCPAAPVRGGHSVAVTVADTSARSGPSRAFPVSGRFPTGCALALAGYCLGDAVPSATAPTWADSRWLLVDRHPDGPAALVARQLSGEPAAPRFLPSAAVAPAGTHDTLPLLSGAECGRDGLRGPGETALEDVLPGPLAANLSARVAGAADIGFARWVASDPQTGSAPLLRGEAYQQLSGPGATGPGGRRTVSWDYRALIADLDPGRRTPTVTVAVLAVGCEAPSAPAAEQTAALTTYTVSGVRLSGPRQRLTGRQIPGLDGPLGGLDLRRLTAAACQPPE
ncbi:MAG TPA: hypothetical protein VEL73_10615, partial [Mycobacteriales bacterium]|nr:hypothetical protein [Mycobacteriales bacterium]